MEKQDKLALTGEMLNACTKPSEIMDLPAVRERWVGTYAATTGRQDGELKFEAEKVLFIQTIGEDANLAACSKVSIYSSFILLAVSGLSLRDGQSYLIPYKDKCVWMPGWKGRLEQIKQIPNVKYVNEPVCVFEGEDFEYEVFEGETKVLRHKPLLNTEGKKILAVYATIEYDFGKKTFLMKREEVISIRDRYSQSYKDYINIKPDANGKRVKTGTSKKTGKPYSFEIEEPMWISDEVQAFKKTLIKRIYNTIPKSGSLKYLDKRLEEISEDTQIKDTDAEELLEAKLRGSEIITDAEIVEENDTDTGSQPNDEGSKHTAIEIPNESNNPNSLFPEDGDKF